MTDNNTRTIPITINSNGTATLDEISVVKKARRPNQKNGVGPIKVTRKRHNVLDAKSKKKITKKKRKDNVRLFCPICNAVITKQSRFDKHIENHRIKKAEKLKKELTSIVQVMKQPVVSPRQRSTNPKSKRKLKLFSKRGTTIYEPMECSLCKKAHNITWRYTQSSRGEVYLCKDCKAKASRDKAKPQKVDALSRRLSGSFGSGKHR